MSAVPPHLRFAGYAALFDKADGARDTILPGALRRTLAERQGSVPLYWQHRPEQRIGVIETIAEDERGLRVIGRLDNPGGRASRMLLTRTVDGLSFGFHARRFRHSEAGRLLADIELFEVSLVTHPLQGGARIHMIA